MLFFQGGELSRQIKKTILWAYEHSPINLSSLTGLYHPGVTRLAGTPLLGRAGYAMANEGMGLNDEFEHVEHLAKQDPRGLCYGSMGNVPFLFVSRPSDIQQIMLMNEDCIDRQGALKPFTFIFGENNLFGLPTGPEWQGKRRELKRWIFTEEALVNLAPPMQEILDEYMAQLLLNGECPSLERFMVTLAMDLFSRSVLHTGSLSNDASSISEEFARSMKTAANPLSMFILKFKSMAEYFQLHFNTRLDVQKESLDKILTDLFLMPNVNSLMNEDNFIKPYFAEVKNEQGDIDEVRLREAVSSSLQDASSILLAGHETTSRLLQFTVMLLARNPEILAGVREEIAANQPEDGVWSAERLERLTYLRRVLKESLRLYPPVPVIPRMVTRSFSLGDLGTEFHSREIFNELWNNRDKSRDLVLSEGTLIFIGVRQTHRLSSVYDEPDEFRPERFEHGSITQAQEEQRYKCAFIPFGLGQRDCIGRYVALQEAALCLIHLVSRFNFRIEEGIEMENTYIQGTLKHKQNVAIRFTRYDASVVASEKFNFQ